jgi:hypothetical protein
VNKLQSFLAENDTRVQPVEPDRQAAVEGGLMSNPVRGDDGGCIPKPPWLPRPKSPIVIHGQW